MMKAIPRTFTGLGLFVFGAVAVAQDSSLTRNAVSEKNGRLEEVVVTGSHIRGVGVSTAPVTVLDSDYINSTGISTTTALIASLPQNFSLASQSGVSVPGVSVPEVQGSSINLRGIGEGTTLTLLNGRRMAPGFFGRAVDISALPLSAIERVEVMTDGASALYGSDAVGGVVNFILRKDFDGAETRLWKGWADGDVNEERIGQTLGRAWSSGNALLSLEYYRRDLLPAAKRDFVPSTSDVGSLLPRDKNYSGMFSGRQELNESVALFADALYSARQGYNEGGSASANVKNSIDNPQIATAAGLEWNVGGEWQISLSGSYSSNDLESRGESDTNRFAGIQTALTFTDFETLGAEIKADGSLFELPGGSVRMAIGSGWRSESFDVRRYSRLFSGSTVHRPGDLKRDQTIYSAFGEVSVPIIGAANSIHGVNLLQLSLSGRFDDYSNFGSSFDPRIGLVWKPIDDVRIRGSYGTSFSAPALTDYNESLSAALAYFFPTADSQVLELSGIDVESLSAQESESWSLGLEYSPSSVPGLDLSLNYYRIDYRGRIAYPDVAGVFAAVENPSSSFGSLIIRNPSAEQVNEAIAAANLGDGLQVFDSEFNPLPTSSLDPSTVDAIIDLRRRNLAATRTSGLDASVQYVFDIADGSISLGLTGTYILELQQQVTAASARVDTVDTFWNPPDWRVRGSIGWQRAAWAVNLFVDHKDAYTDNRRLVQPVRVSSYTSVDTRLSYEFKENIRDGLFSGLTVSASVRNLFDKDPPHTAIVQASRDMGFDPTNADPMGRFVSLELVKMW